MMKQRSKLETKRMVASKKDCNFKSKSMKQVNQADPGKVSYGRKKTIIDSLYQDNDAKKSVRDRAEEVLQSIPVEYPRFSKAMLPSNVSYSFWLILPLDFCKFYMPNEDVRVVLVDDRGKERDTTYLTKRHGLSAGWRGFAMEHRLLEGDILVFHMISPCRFKVNIVRVYGLDVADAALILMLIRDSRNRTYDVAKDSSANKKSEKRVKKLGQVHDQSESQFDDCIAEVLEVKKEMTPRKSKKRVKKLGLVEVHSERQSDDCNADVPEEMAPRISKGFGVKLTDDKTSQDKATRARPDNKKDAAKYTTIVQKEKSPKRKHQQTKPTEAADGAPSKRPKPTTTTSSLMETQLDLLVAPFIRDDELTSWKNLTAENENNAMIRASAQLLIHSIGSAARFEKEKASLSALENEKSKLSKQVKETEQKMKKECRQKDAAIAFLHKEIEEQTDMLKHLNNSIDILNKENGDLRASLQALEEDKKSGWLAEKQKLADDSFEKGFKYCLTGFLANDPEYSFDKFGQETIDWIVDFKAKNAVDIKARRIELGLDVLEGEEDAPSEHGEIVVHTGTTPPHVGDSKVQQSPSNTDILQVEPLQTIPLETAQVNPFDTAPGTEDVPPA